MQKSPILLVAVLLAIVGGAVLYFQSFQATPELGTQAPAAVSGRNADPGAPEVARGAPKTGTETMQAPARIAGESSRRPDALTGPALIGRVVDEAGLAVAGARVSSLAGRFGPGAMNPREFGSFDVFDPAAVRERLAQWAENRAETTTDAEGRFRLVVGTGTDDGATVNLRVRARGHRILDQMASKPTEADTDVGTLELSRGAVVQGRVVDRNNTPLVGASVARASGGQEMPAIFETMRLQMTAGIDDGSSVLTDESGRFELEHVPAGEFALSAQHPDYPMARLEGLTVAAGTSLRDLVIVANLGFAVSGRVRGIPEGTEGIRVVATRQRDGSGGEGDLRNLLGDAMEEIGAGFGEKTVRVDASGAFTLRGLTPGETFRLSAVQSGQSFTGAARCSEALELPPGLPGGNTEGVELHYDAGTSVTFVAVDAQTGRPVENLWVRDRLRGGAGGLGDLMAMAGPMMAQNKRYPDGRVVLPNLRPKADQSLELTLESIGYARFQRQDIDVGTPGLVDLGTVELTPTPVVRTTVVRAGDGRPVEGANVRLTRAGGEGRQFGGFGRMQIPGMGRGSGPFSGTTDASGHCTLNSHPGDEVTLRVEGEGFARYEKALTLPANDSADVRVELVRGGTVVVTVLDVNNAPLTDTRVEHRGGAGERGTATTDAEGAARFDELSPGTHRFRIGSRSRGRGLEALMGGRGSGGDAAPWQEVTVVDGETATLTLSKAPTATLTGFVRENGAPIAGARVTFQKGLADESTESGGDAMASALQRMARRGGQQRTRTDDEGGYELGELPAGEHRLQVTHGDRAMPTTVRVSLRNGPNVFDINLTTAVIRGVVRDPSGTPIAGASVRAREAGADSGAADIVAAGMRAFGRGRGGDGGVRTDEQGRFELRGVQPDARLEVTADAEGFAAASSDPVTVPPGGTADADVQLFASGKIDVSRGGGGGGFLTVIATFEDAEGIPPVMGMMRRGSTTLEGLRPGRWRVTLRQMAGGESPEPQIVQVRAGATASASF